jgi:N4-gp56 family major capsid protein
MADVLTTFSAVSNDAPNVYIASQMFTLAERYLKVLKYASRYTLPQRYGKTIRVDRVKRLALPTVPLTEGVPPSAVGLTVENVDVTVDQWGIVAFLTDLGLITTKHPMLAKAIDRTALAIAETIEREACKMLLGGTAVVFAAGTTRAGLVATNVVNTGIVLTATTQLRALGAPAFDGDLYAGVIPPQVEADVLKTDATFQSAHNFVNVRAQEFGEIGVWSGVRWTRGNFLPIFAGVGAPVTTAATATVAGSLLGITGGAYTANATLSGGIIVVARDINSDYERKVSVANTTFALGAGNTGFSINTPTSANYVYDVYAPPAAAGTGTPVLAASRIAANTVVTITTLPTSTVTAPANPASGVEVFVTFIVGRDAFGRVELDGMSLQSYITPPGASFSNPLAQGRKVGAKIAWKSFILDNNFIVRIESGSFFAAQLPA